MVKISIGSDPEFVIGDKDGDFISAEEIFINCKDCNPCKRCDIPKCIGIPRNYGACDNCDDYDDDIEYCGYCDECEEREDIYNAEIGCDGCSNIGELRPTFEFTPQEHHDNIADLISQIDIPKEYQIWAGTCPAGLHIGGHIHLGAEGLGSFEFSKYISRFAGILLRKIERPEDARLRGLCDFSYGQFGAHNLTNYGLEWRMPASWLVSSEITLSALSLARVVANEYLINPRRVKQPTLCEQIRTVESSYMTTKLIHEVERMKEYNKYSKELEPLFQMLTNKERWKTNVDIRDEW